MAMQSVSPVFDDVQQWFRAFTQPTVLIELGALALCVALAWLMVSALRRALGRDEPRSILFGRKVVDGVLFPLTLLGLGYVARAVLALWVPLAAFKVVIPVLISLVVIRVGVKVLQAAFPQAAWVRPIERTISWLAWLAMVLWVTGLLPLVLQELDEITWKVGATTLSVRTMIEGAVTACAVLIVTLWVSSAIESRLLRSAKGSELSLRKAFSNAARALLIFLGLILALSAVGIDLTALSVLGGAVGVGIGFGLQKLAANYVSGFVILAERSVRIGDNVRVDGFEGHITDITGRYTVIRSGVGRESIVPNEMLITQRVENLSLTDPRVWMSTVISVGYDSDVDLVVRLLGEAALANPRVLREPGPLVALSAFGADGLEFTVGYWITDPESGTLGLRSDINRAILAALRAHHIDIPYPQRVVHLRPQDVPASSEDAHASPGAAPSPDLQGPLVRHGASPLT
ncbi:MULTISPECIES: mechanosensitive ion channel family protein [unclassified Acidovorax]|uniref:mechanosensitive ion channel family protein n=1 Tax=unclassified Acidovorax TaxID=2684926 RepID=UPI000B401BED|nr:MULTISPECIES: mechanosensitive ion channel domain-containing protein [unclassified Acidovorax]MBP3981137.1 mechanosensitive ion channel [Acidovorax sp. JG5]